MEEKTLYYKIKVMQAALAGKPIEYWKGEGFAFEARFPNEYDLWVNRETMQKLRRYCDGREWLSNLTTGEYELVQKPPQHDA